MPLTEYLGPSPWSDRMINITDDLWENMKLPMDWPRINQFPEWFTVSAEKQYQVSKGAGGKITRASGRKLAEGLPVSIKAGEEQVLKVILQPGKKISN